MKCGSSPLLSNRTSDLPSFRPVLLKLYSTASTLALGAGTSPPPSPVTSNSAKVFDSMSTATYFPPSSDWVTVLEAPAFVRCPDLRES